ncbi:MAG: tRNA (adenosine(37)-N6)-threonylcarbamoyltransferase complex dimerization subunit type 1 TsaB [Desulfobacteraceae bacterium 4572_130]|nr:MAG: tRNA (adenosine(37)-N6)-threonylcarbamoyltransferase complex dimerization subunit type 1 TsaB [Desulfobacteraceae bacterium 4572_130]
MKILALDTAEQSCSLALVKDGILVCEEFYLNKATHSLVVMDMIKYMLDTRAGTAVEEIDGFVVTKGPGSFTGLRIGISTIKGLAFATSKPVAGISSLDGIAWQMAFSSLPVCAMMDAKRNEVYCALYHFKDGMLLEKSNEVALSPEKIVNLTGGEKTLFAGSGALAFKDIIKKTNGEKAVFASGFQNNIKAYILAEIVFKNPNLLSQSLSSIVPVYIRKSDAEVNYNKKQSGY